MASAPTIHSDAKPRKHSAVRKSSSKSPAIQSAVAIRRANGQSKLQIAKDLAIAPNTVTNIIALNGIEEQIAEARKNAIALAPAAVAAIDRDLKFPGTGALGLRLLNDIGVIGEDALDSIRRHSQRQAGAINVLVQSGATLHIAEDTGKRNVQLADAPTTYSNVQNDENNSTDTVNNKVTDAHGTPTGKHPKAAPTHQ